MVESLFKNYRILEYEFGNMRGFLCMIIDFISTHLVKLRILLLRRIYERYT